MRSKEIMTVNVITIQASRPLVEAYALMQRRGVRHLPVLDERNAVVGILSDRDIQRAMKVKKINNFEQNIFLEENLMVEDFMNWPVRIVSESTTIQRVTEEMLEQKISAVLVQDIFGNLNGIVTTDDLLKLLLNSRTSPLDLALRSISQYFVGP